MRKDPVCQMTIDESKASSIGSYQGKTYYFCSPSCKVKFDKNPEQYVGKATSGSA